MIEGNHASYTSLIKVTYVIELCHMLICTLFSFYG
jgi:hypothetical protein